MDARFYGYKHWTLEETPRCFYVGKGLGDRPKQTRNRSHKWRAIVKRLGLRVEVCIGPVTNEEACAWEVERISQECTFSECHLHDSVDIGCNFTRGGDGVVGRRHDEEAKRRIGESSRGRKATEQARANMRKAQSKRGVVQYDLQGNVVETFSSQAEAGRATDNAASNISKCCRRRLKSIGGFVWRYEGDRFDPKLPAVLTTEHRRKLSEAHRGMKHTPETRHQISETQRGKLLSEEHKEKIGVGMSRYHAMKVQDDAEA